MTRTRTRPAAPAPAPRTRQRPVNPGSSAPVVRTRARPAAPAPTYPWRLTNEKLAWACEAPKERLLTLGQIDLKTKPSSWAGWPNGSCYNAQGGVRHLGRHIRDRATGKYHVLRWVPGRGAYFYVGLVTHDLALTLLK